MRERSSGQFSMQLRQPQLRASSPQRLFTYRATSLPSGLGALSLLYVQCCLGREIKGRAHSTHAQAAVQPGQTSQGGSECWWDPFSPRPRILFLALSFSFRNSFFIDHPRFTRFHRVGLIQPNAYELMILRCLLNSGLCLNHAFLISQHALFQFSTLKKMLC